MPTLTPYALSFRGGMRIGTRGVNLEETGLTVPSDTLFAALADCLRRSGRNVDGWLAPFIKSPPKPPFLLSSAFPYAGDLRFYPVPADLTCLLDKSWQKRRGKQLKRVRFLSEGLLTRVLNGEGLDAWLFPEKEFEEPAQGAVLQGGCFWLACDEIDLLPAAMRRPAGKRHALTGLQVWHEGTLPHVTIDRMTSASTVFQSGRITFAEGCGLWFGVEWLDEQAVLPGGETYHAAFEAALGVLAGDGLGADRSAGGGAFQANKLAPLALPAAQSGSPAYLLSRYHPREDELPGVLSSPLSAYRLVSVGGWLNTIDGPAQRRKRVTLLAEGSVVALPAQPAGDLVDVRPTYPSGTGEAPHGVYRSGLALAAGWAPSEVKDA